MAAMRPSAMRTTPGKMRRPLTSTTLPATVCELAGISLDGSNNAWYGDSLAPHQHLQIARMRSLETGRPLLRATTNGISALVDHRGELTGRSPQFETFVLEGVIQPMRGATPYVRWGDYAVLALMAALAGALWWRVRAVRAAGLESA